MQSYNHIRFMLDFHAIYRWRSLRQLQFHLNAILPGLLNGSPAVTGSSDFCENSRTDMGNFVDSFYKTSGPIIKISPVLMSYVLIFNLFFVLCNTYCIKFFRKTFI